LENLPYGIFSTADKVKEDVIWNYVSYQTITVNNFVLSSFSVNLESELLSANTFLILTLLPTCLMDLNWKTVNMSWKR
jgi:hypothetical protein